MAAKKQKGLTQKQIEKKLLGLSGWEVDAKWTTLEKEFRTDSFVAGLAFVAKIAVHAEILNHHPDITLSYGKVNVKLSTHDVEGLTNADFELAKRIENVSTR